MTNPHDLKGLSEKAMDGELTAAGPDHFGDFTLQINGGGLAVGAICNGEMWRMGGKFDEHSANAAFLCALWNGYRSNALLPSDRVRELEEENARLRYLINVLIENHPDDIVADGGCTVFDLWRKDARNALKGETDNG